MNPSVYKTVVTGLLKILSHLIPDDEALEKIYNDSTFINNEVNKNMLQLNPSTEIIKTMPISQRLQIATVYAIYYKDELIYIGQTTRPIEKRMKEHIENFKIKSKEQYLYSIIDEVDFSKLRFQILFYTAHGILQEDLDAIETALITTNKPRGNVKDKYYLPQNEEEVSKDRKNIKLEKIINDLEELLSEYQL